MWKIWTKVKLFFVTLFHKFVYSKSEYMELAETVASLKNCLDALRTQATATTTLLEKTERKLEDAKSQRNVAEEVIASLEAELALAQGHLESAVKERDALVVRLGQLEEYKQVDAEYLRDVQKQLADEFTMHPVFGFPRSPGLPGSTCFTSTYITGEHGPTDFTATRGRVILDDFTTKQINQAPHIYQKIQVILQYLENYGNLNRILRDIINAGGMSITLCYREETTTYEMFYEITNKNYSGDAVLRIDPDTGLKVRDKEEG